MSDLIRVLEDALVANPDDRAAHAAYADLLMERGDPRGELIQVQLTLDQLPRKSPQRDALRRRYAALAVEQGRALLGDLAPYLLERPSTYAEPFRFRLGWLDVLYVDRLDVALARALARAPETRLLSTLRVDLADESPADYQPGDDTPTEQRFPALFVLLASSNLANLRRLEVRALALSRDELDCILCCPHLPRLGHLGLRVGTPLGTEGCEAIIESGILGRLNVLDLQRSGLTDVQARVLASAELKHLELLNVDDNHLTEDGLRALWSTGVTVQGSPFPIESGDFSDLEYEPYEGDTE
jgi:uncharacterized protein (TIGR02996 family)